MLLFKLHVSMVEYFVYMLLFFHCADDETENCAERNYALYWSFLATHKYYNKKPKKTFVTVTLTHWKQLSTLIQTTSTQRQTFCVATDINDVKEKNLWKSHKDLILKKRRDWKTIAGMSRRHWNNRF